MRGLIFEKEKQLELSARQRNNRSSKMKQHYHREIGIEQSDRRVDKFTLRFSPRPFEAFHEKHETNLPRLDSFTRVPSFKKLSPPAMLRRAGGILVGLFLPDFRVITGSEKRGQSGSHHKSALRSTMESLRSLASTIKRSFAELATIMIIRLLSHKDCRKKRKNKSRTVFPTSTLLPLFRRSRVSQIVFL